MGTVGTVGTAAARAQVRSCVAGPEIVHIAVIVPAPSTPICPFTGTALEATATGVDQTPPDGRRATTRRPPEVSSHQIAAASPAAPSEIVGVAPTVAAGSEIGVAGCHAAAPATGAPMSAASATSAAAISVLGVTHYLFFVLTEARAMTTPLRLSTAW